jgi:hypothetical protein
VLEQDGSLQREPLLVPHASAQLGRQRIRLDAVRAGEHARRESDRDRHRCLRGHGRKAAGQGARRRGSEQRGGARASRRALLVVLRFDLTDGCGQPQGQLDCVPFRRLAKPIQARRLDREPARRAPLAHQIQGVAAARVRGLQQRTRVAAGERAVARQRRRVGDTAHEYRIRESFRLCEQICQSNGLFADARIGRLDHDVRHERQVARADLRLASAARAREACGVDQVAAPRVRQRQQRLAQAPAALRLQPLVQQRLFDQPERAAQPQPQPLEVEQLERLGSVHDGRRARQRDQLVRPRLASLQRPARIDVRRPAVAGTGQQRQSE